MQYIRIDIRILECMDVIQRVEYTLNGFETGFFVSPIVQRFRCNSNGDWEHTNPNPNPCTIKEKERKIGEENWKQCMFRVNRYRHETMFAAVAFISCFFSLLLCELLHLPESVSAPQSGSLATPPETAWTAPFSFRLALNRFSSSTVSFKCCFCILSRSWCATQETMGESQRKGKLLGVQCSDIMSITIDEAITEVVPKWMNEFVE